MKTQIINKLENIKQLVTNTPLVGIQYKYNNEIKTIYAKCEWYSLTGSTKDKVAYQIFKNAFETGELKVGDKVVEVSSGNMGIAISAIGRLLGLDITIIMPKNMSDERKKLIRAYGATLVETENFHESFALCEKYETEGYFRTHQFQNPQNKVAHEQLTAQEILSLKDKLHANNFVAGIGTSGTLSGIGSVLKKELNYHITAIEPDNARIITELPPYGHHELQGLSDEILPALFEQDLCDEVLQITDSDAIAMSQKICNELSLGVGISSGANFLGCVLSGHNSITIFPDDNKKYLSTKLSIPISTSLVDSIELIGWEFIK
jgi:cysteine synthase A